LLRGLASGCGDNTVKLWEVKTGDLLRTLSGHTNQVNSVVFSPDGHLLASGSGDGTIKLWEVGTGELLHTLSEHTLQVAFSPDGCLLALGYSSVKLWDVETRKLIYILTGHTKWINSLAFSPDGRLLALGDANSTIKLWDVEGGKLVYTLTETGSYGNAVAFSPDGYLLTSGGGTIKLWEVETGDLLRTLSGQGMSVNSVAFSPEGYLLASGGNTVKLWEVETGDLLRTLSGQGMSVNSVAFSLDGGLLASGGWGTTINLWKMDEALNTPPTASFTWEVLSFERVRLLLKPKAGDRIRFDASTSTDADGEIVKYEWDWDSDGAWDKESPDPVIEHQLVDAGTHQVTIRVSDDDGLTAETTKTIVIERRDLIQADFTFHVVDEVLHKIQLDAITSIDTMGEIVRYEWDWDGDGIYDTAVEVPEMMHRFNGEGPYHVTLTIVDDQGNRASCTGEVGL